MRLRAVLLALALAGPGMPVLAQAPDTGAALSRLPLVTPPVVQSAILTVETERLFSESAFGRRIAREIEVEGQTLAAENRDIEAELTAEERRLTRERTELTPEEFREEAEAFDARVQEMRETQDAKARALNNRSDNARRRFLSAAQPVLVEIMREAGAAVVVERRAVLVSLDATDITDLAIARIDEAIGDGSDLEPLPEE